MEQEIYFTNKELDFSQVSISQPISVQGGAYFTKIKMNNEPLYVQPPKCSTKQGLNETNKKAYMDLMFTNEDDEVVEWFEHLEERLIELIYEKREIWFQNEMDKDDIENFFNPVCRAFRGGKFHLIRIHIPKNKTASSQYHCNVYDENENIIAIQDLNDSHSIIPCIEVQGIKFSARNFQLELVGKQIMLLNNKPIFNSCVIKRNNTERHNIEQPSVEQPSVVTAVQSEENTPHDNSKNDIIDNNEINNNTTGMNINIAESEDNKLASLSLSNEDSLGKNIDESVNLDSQILQRTGKTDLDKDTQETSGEEISIKGLQQNIVTALTEESDSDVEDVEPNDEPNDEPNNEATIEPDMSTYLEESKTNKTNITNITKSFDLEDITDNLNVHDERNIKLKKPNEVYYEIYKIAKGKAKQHKKAAITHYLEAKKIKNTYLMDDLDYSDDSLEDDDEDDEEDEDDIKESAKIKNQINEIVEDLI